MSHLERRYTDYFYVEGKNGRLIRMPYMTRREFLGKFPYSKLPGPNGVFPCEHEQRGFLPKMGKKSNHTHARMKRRRKARAKRTN